MTTTTTIDDSPAAIARRRADRQRDLVPPERLAACQAVVIGVGAVGRQVALQLTAMGISSMLLIDHDEVAVENLAPQGYWPTDLTRRQSARHPCALSFH